MNRCALRDGGFFFDLWPLAASVLGAEALRTPEADQIFDEK